MTQRDSVPLQHVEGSSTADPDVPTTGRVVVVDDQPANVELLVRMLRAAGISDVSTVTDPQQAVPHCLEIGADLLILDLHMPGIDGFEVMARLRAALPERAFLPVMVLTADITPETRRRALAAGAHDFLNKPFDNVEVELRVRNMLRTTQLHGELERERASLEQRVGERTRELQRANDQLREADQMKRDFIAMVSHEMRTPLTVIKGFSEMITRLWERMDQSQRAAQVSALKRNTDRLERLIDNVLLAAALEAGTAASTEDVAERPSTVVRDLLRDAVRDTELDPDSVVIDCDPHLQASVDRELLHPVLTNLLTNAQKYGQPPVHIAVATSDEELQIAVRDHGTGIPPAFASRMFEQFSQASVGDRRNATGTGLGLWIARRLARSHGGELRYEPAAPGARFELHLPLESPLAV